MITTTPSSPARCVRTRPDLPESVADEDAAAADNLARLQRPSKTRRKEASHDLQLLGAALVELSDERLAGLGLTEPLLDALQAYRRIRSHEARRRQMQLIGKLMRLADVDAARRAVDEVKLGRAQDSLALHQAERWRAELIADDEAATRFASEHPGTDTQRLRALVRNARKDASLVPEKRSGRAFRELFQFVRENERPADA
jgi:ribosome-associated protein